MQTGNRSPALVTGAAGYTGSPFVMMLRTLPGARRPRIAEAYPVGGGERW